MYHTLRRFWRMTAPRDQWRYAALLVLMLFAALLDFIGIGAIPIFVGALIDSDRVFEHPRIAPILESVGIVNAEQLLFWGGCAFIGFFVFRSAYQIALFYVSGRFVNRHMARVTVDLFHAYMAAPYTFHLMRSSAESIRSLHFETNRVLLSVIRPLMQLILSTFFLVALGSLVLMAEPVLGLFTVGFLGIVGFAYLRSIRKRAASSGREQSYSTSRLLQTAQESITAFKDIRVRGKEQSFVQRIQDASTDRAHAFHFTMFAHDSAKPVIEGLGVIGIGVIIYVLVSRGDSTQEVAEGVVLLAAVMARLLPSMNTFSGSLVSLRSNIVSLDHLVGEFEVLRNVQTSKPSGNPIVFRESISLRDVKYSYPEAHTPSLRGINVDIQRGSSIAFTGSTGAGKTTVVDILLGLLTPQTGEVLVDGRNIADNLRSWQDRIGYIPQTIHLFDDNIRANIALGVPGDEIDDGRIRDVLRIAQLEAFVDGMPKGIFSEIGERGIRLSGGQRQRIGIARALYHDPEVLVLDEATAAVDNTTEGLLMAALEEARKDRTLIMIAHRLSTVRGCDKIYFMKDGLIVDAGTYEYLCEENEEFRMLTI